MRTYPNNSLKARARILALSMVVDGHLDPSEMKVLEDTPVMGELQLNHALLREALEELCADMLHTAVRNGSVEINAALLDGVLAEITEPDLRRRMLAAMLKIVDADSWLADAEGILLARACQLWRAADGFGQTAAPVAA